MQHLNKNLKSDTTLEILFTKMCTASPFTVKVGDIVTGMEVKPRLRGTGLHMVPYGQTNELLWISSSQTL